jgi:hypothetical protein
MLPQQPFQSFQSQPTPAVHQRFEEAYLTYIRAMQEAGIGAGTERSIMEAYAAYVDALQQPWMPAEVQNKITAAYENYAKALREAFAPESLHRRATEAYRAYVRALREAWLHLDSNLIDAEAMIAICQTTLIAAGIAAAAEKGPVAAAGVEASGTKAL